MDANRRTVAVTIAGRPMDLIMPTPDQMLGLKMLEAQDLPEGLQLEATMGLFRKMIPTEDDWGWFVLQLTLGEYTVNDLMLSLKEIGTSPAAVVAPVPPRVRKAAAKKTAKRRPV